MKNPAFETKEEHGNRFLTAKLNIAISEDLWKVNEQLDASGELATHTFGDMKKSFHEALLDGAKSTNEMAVKVNKLADAQETLKEKTDAAIKSLHQQQALEQEAISAKSGAQIA